MQKKKACSIVSGPAERQSPAGHAVVCTSQMLCVQSLNIALPGMFSPPCMPDAGCRPQLTVDRVKIAPHAQQLMILLDQSASALVTAWQVSWLQQEHPAAVQPSAPPPLPQSPSPSTHQLSLCTHITIRASPRRRRQARFPTAGIPGGEGRRSSSQTLLPGPEALPLGWHTGSVPPHRRQAARTLEPGACTRGWHESAFMR